MPYSWTVEQKYASGPTVIHMDLVTAKKRAKQFELGGMASVVTGSKGWIWRPCRLAFRRWWDRRGGMRLTRRS